MAADRLLTVAAVARRLAVPRSRVLRLIRRKALTGVRINRQWRVEPEAVDAFIARNRSIATDEQPPAVDDRQLRLSLEVDDPIAPGFVEAVQELKPEDVPF